MPGKAFPASLSEDVDPSAHLSTENLQFWIGTYAQTQIGEITARKRIVYEVHKSSVQKSVLLPAV